MHNTLLKTSVLGFSILALASAAVLAQPRAEPRKPLTPVTEEMLRNPPASDWLMWRRTYDAWGYSPLDRINKGNVKRLNVAWTWALSTGATEITPIVHDGVLDKGVNYLQKPFSHANLLRKIRSALNASITETDLDG